jgi:hypothetical protein
MEEGSCELITYGADSSSISVCSEFAVNSMGIVYLTDRNGNQILKFYSNGTKWRFIYLRVGALNSLSEGAIISKSKYQYFYLTMHICHEKDQTRS